METLEGHETRSNTFYIEHHETYSTSLTSKEEEEKKEEQKYNLLSSFTPSFLQILTKAASDNAHFNAST